MTVEPKPEASTSTPASTLLRFASHDEARRWFDRSGSLIPLTVLIDGGGRFTMFPIRRRPRRYPRD